MNPMTTSGASAVVESCEAHRQVGAVSPTDVRYRSARALLPAAAICFGLTAWGISDLARAQSGNHGDGHAENHDWYQNLTQPDTGFPCCNGSTSSVEGDCRPTRAFLDEDGLWYALLDGQWVPIPPRVVLKQLAPDGHSHICASQSGLIYCFLAGSPKI
jgi:hypothetical protein